MALSDDLAYTSAADLALRIRRRELSPVEVVDAFIDRIETRNPRRRRSSSFAELVKGIAPPRTR